MPDELVIYFTKYGYLAIFLLVFSQEVGAPNPIPNELVLLFSGYMIFMGLLKLPLVIITAVFADLAGTLILYTIFYFSGAYILQIKSKWLPIPIKTIQKFKERMSQSGLSGICIGRLTPFIRGYTSVIAGLLQLKFKVFLPIALITASIWVTVYVAAGIFLGPFWDRVIENIPNIKYFLMIVFFVLVIVIVLRSIIKYRTVNSK